jgi:putative transposase
MTKQTRTKEQVVDELLDELLEDCKSPEDLLGESGMLRQLTKGMVDRMLECEMTDHLGYEKNDPVGKNTGNSRNGKSRKTIQTDQGPIGIEVPRDRNCEFEPQLVPKGRRRFKEFDDKIISLYARGMTTREIQGHLRELYGSEVSPELISRITDGVQEEVAAWQSRPLDRLYPIIYLDAIYVKIRDSGTVKNKAVHLALGINLEGDKELLGLWIAQSEGAKFWLSVLTELKNRGLKDILIACVDGLTGFPEAIETAFPETLVQLCIVHKVRHSLTYVTWKDRRAVAADLRPIYQAATVEEAETHLEAFAEKWDEAYPSISRSWHKSWDQIIPFFAFPPEIRKVIYTTNAIESMNRSLRKIIKNRGAFPTDQAATKLLFLAIRNIAKKWNKPIRDWKPALNRFAIMFEARVQLP